jgi:hypothetical protein
MRASRCSLPDYAHSVALLRRVGDPPLVQAGHEPREQGVDAHLHASPRQAEDHGSDLIWLLTHSWPMSRRSATQAALAQVEPCKHCGVTVDVYRVGAREAFADEEKNHAIRSSHISLIGNRCAGTLCAQCLREHRSLAGSCASGPYDADESPACNYALRGGLAH